MNIVERIKDKAQEKGLSIKALEEKIGLGNGTIKRWEHSSPQCNKIMLVANYLQVPLAWLVEGTESETLTNEEKELLNEYRSARPEVQESARLLLRAGKQETKLPTCKTG